MYSDQNPNVKMCVYVCPDGYYRQNRTNNWTCVTSCLSNQFIDYVTMTCVTECPTGSYAYSNGTCLNSCPASTFADPNSPPKCQATCSGGLFSDPTTRTCVSKCPHGYFGDITNGYTCQQTCTVNTQFGDPLDRLCVTKENCPSPYIYADNFSRECVTKCPESENTFGDSSTNACVSSCPWSSSLYSYKDPSTQTCVTACPSNPSSYRYNSSF